jgi:hypothetical protein
MVMNSGLEGTEEEVVVAYLNLLSWSSPEIAQENKILRIACSLLKEAIDTSDVILWTPLRTNTKLRGKFKNLS